MSIDLELALQKPGRPLVGPGDSQDYAEQVDLIARLVRNLPDQPPTAKISERLRIIAVELERRIQPGEVTEPRSAPTPKFRSGDGTPGPRLTP